MTILIGILLTIALMSLLCPPVLIIIMFTVLMTCMVLWLCPALRKHIREQKSVHDEIKIDPYIEVGNEMPDVVLYDMVDGD